MLASLWGTKVFAWGGSTGTRATSFLNAQGSTLNNLALKAFLGRIGLLSSHHLDKSKSAGFFGMRVEHDLTLLNRTILLEQTCNLLFRETRVNASYKQIGARVDGAIILRRRATIILGAAVDRSVPDEWKNCDMTNRGSTPFPPGEAERLARGLSLRRFGRGDALRSRS